MEISDTQANLIRHLTTEVMLNRQRHGAPIPQQYRDLLTFISARGSDLRGHPTHSNQESGETITTRQAAAILGCSTRHIRLIHADLDGRKTGRDWMFQRSTVTEYATTRSTK